MINLLDLLPTIKAQPHVLITGNPDALGEIVKHHYNLIIYSRKVFKQLEEAVQALLNSSFAGIDNVMEYQHDWREPVARAFAQQLSVNGLLLQPLVNDIARCCELFSGITNSGTLRLSLKIISTDACRKFHIDGYAYRLLCTYNGPGTEWTYNDNVRRSYLGEGENDDIIKDWARIEKIATYDIAILKGELPHLRTGKGIVHRSPPIQHTNDKRLVLRIDYTS